MHWLAESHFPSYVCPWVEHPAAVLPSHPLEQAEKEQQKGWGQFLQEKVHNYHSRYIVGSS